MRAGAVFLVLVWCSCATGPAVRRGPGPLIVVAAGDISHPKLNHQVDTAKLVESLQPAAVLVLGDAQYGEGTLEQFQNAYAPTWGRFKDITWPTPGNHEYKSGAVGYFAYFGPRAGNGTYSFDVGDWHFVSLNTGEGCHDIACDAQSEQVKWLEADLANAGERCVIAYWHHPRFSSGKHGPFLPSSAFWKVLSAHHVALVLNGHEHFYERLGPVDAEGAPAANGIVQLIVGTGGVGFSDFDRPIATSEARQNDTFGVVRLRLDGKHWESEFVGVPGSTFQDRASGTCP